MNQSNRPPIATFIFVAANIIAAFAILWNPDLVYQFGFVAREPSLYAAVTSLFLHQNVLHLLGNMVFLAAVGPAVENATGTLRFAIVYMLGGLIGVAAHWLLATKGATPLIGASGCIAACIAYYSMRYLHMQVTVAPKLGVPVLAIIVVWIVLQIGGGFVSIGEVRPQTAYWAHIGGFIAGLILSFTFKAPQTASEQMGRRVVEQMEGRSPAAKLAAIENHLKQHPGDLASLREKAECLALLDDPDKECQALSELLELVPQAEQMRIIARLDEIGRLGCLTSLKRTLLAEKWKSESPDLSRIILASVLQAGPDDQQRPDALLAMAALDIEESPEKAQIWLDELFARYPLHPAADLATTRGWHV